MFASLHQLPFVPLVLTMLCVLVAGIYLACRRRDSGEQDVLRQALVWGGGFVVYAVFDYLIFMN